MDLKIKNSTALPCLLTQTSGSRRQGHGLTFSLLQWLFVSVCGCMCLALCICWRNGNWKSAYIDHAVQVISLKTSHIVTASERQRWCEPHCTKSFVDRGSETMCNEDFPSSQTLHQVISVSSSSVVESVLINEITWSSPQMEWKPA